MEDEEDEVGLMVVTEGSVRTEKWEVDRIKKAKKVNVTLPQGGVTVAALLFTWQKLDAGGKASMDALDDLSLDVAGCDQSKGPASGPWFSQRPKADRIRARISTQPPGEDKGTGTHKNGKPRFVAMARFVRTIPHMQCAHKT